MLLFRRVYQLVIPPHSNKKRDKNIQCFTLRKLSKHGGDTWVAKSGRKAFSGKSNFPALAPPLQWLQETAVFVGPGVVGRFFSRWKNHRKMTWIHNLPALKPEYQRNQQLGTGFCQLFGSYPYWILPLWQGNTLPNPCTCSFQGEDRSIPCHDFPGILRHSRTALNSDVNISHFQEELLHLVRISSSYEVLEILRISFLKSWMAKCSYICVLPRVKRMYDSSEDPQRQVTAYTTYRFRSFLFPAPYQLERHSVLETPANSYKKTRQMHGSHGQMFVFYSISAELYLSSRI